jgi:hypothetical protein
MKEAVGEANSFLRRLFCMQKVDSAMGVGWKKSQEMFYKVTDGDDLYVFIDYMDGSEGEVVCRIDLVNEEKDIKTIFIKE